MVGIATVVLLGLTHTMHHAPCSSSDNHPANCNMTKLSLNRGGLLIEVKMHGKATIGT